MPCALRDGNVIRVLARVLVLLGLACPAALSAQRTIPLAPYGGGPLRQIAVVVAGDTLPFLFDTGGGVSVISPELAARIDCTPSGRSAGFRMTGEKLEGPVCRDVPLEIAGLSVRVEAGIMDLAKLLGPNASRVHGMISLRTFERQRLTLDLRGNTLVLETPGSLVRRVRGMRPVPVRLATGLQGGQLDVFVGVPAGPAQLWMLWDSGNQGPTFVAPHALEALGIPEGSAEAHFTIGGDSVLVPLARKEIIHDGVLNGRLVERAVWTLDLANGAMWVGDVAPLLTLPPAAPGAAVVPPRARAHGWYEVTLHVNGVPQRTILQVAPEGARLRFLGEERVFALGDVRADGDRLSFTLPMRAAYPVEIVFDSLTGRGSWGDAARGGEVVAVKVR